MESSSSRGRARSYAVSRGADTSESNCGVLRDASSMPRDESSVSRDASHVPRDASSVLEPEHNIQNSSTINTSATNRSRDSLYELEVTKAPDGRYNIIVHGGVLMPSNKVSRVITESFQKYYNPTGYTWKLVPTDMKRMWFDEFKKSFAWEPNQEIEIHTSWVARARIRYSEFLHEIKCHREPHQWGKPAWIPDQNWASWLEYWEREDVKEKAAIARRNRMSEPDGPGTGISKHRGGSKCVAERLLLKSKATGLSEEDCVPAVYDDIHKHGGQYTSEKAKRLGTLYEDLLQQSIQAAADTPDAPPVSKGKIFLEAVGVDNKHRIFGTGSSAKTIKKKIVVSVSSQMESKEISSLREQLEKERLERQQLEEQMQKFQSQQEEMQEQIRILMGQFKSGSSSTQPPP